MSSFSIQCFRLLLIASSLLAATTASAVPIAYEFNGYVTSVQRASTGAGALQPLEPALPVAGSITFDAERAAPLVSFELRPGGSNAITAQSLSSSMSIQKNATGHESLTVQGGFTHATGTPEATAVAVKLSWGSPLGSQIATDLSTLNLTTLVPGHWNLTLRSQAASCAPSCATQHVVTIHISGLSQNGISPQSEYLQQFSTSPNGWVSSGGSWAVSSGAYANQANALHTTSVYTGIYTEEAFDISARAYSSWGSAGNALGLVFNYIDANNFYELRVNALGTATLNRVVNGTRTTLGTATANTGVRRWFTLRVYRGFLTGSLQAWVDGSRVFDLTVSGSQGGHAGVFASWNQARFDDFSMSVASFRDTDYSSFSEDACGWEPVKGEWNTQNGFYRSSTNQADTAAVTIGGNGEYAISATVYGESGSAGNRQGLIYDYQDANNYRVAYVPPTCGNIEFVEFVNGQRRSVRRDACTIAPAPARRWSPLSLVRHGDATVLFTQSGTYTIKQPAVPGVGARPGVRSGLASSFNISRFDDVLVYTQAGNRACR